MRGLENRSFAEGFVLTILDWLIGNQEIVGLGLIAAILLLIIFKLTGKGH